MLKAISLTLTTAILVVSVLILGAVKNQPKTTVKVGGSGIGGSYQSTTTDQTMLTAAQFQLLKNGPGSLGSVVITLSSATAFNLYDATTTTSHANHATTTLAKFGASAAAGTYTFDAAFARGLIIEFPVGQVTVASTTITWQ